MKDQLENFLKKYGAFKIAVADPTQFEMAKKGCHPRDVMKDCNSVIVFAFHVGFDYYTSLNYFQKEDVTESRVLGIYRDWVSFQLANYLEDRGYKAVVPHGFKDEKEKIAHLSFKLAAYEAGVGVFGRPSIIITPEYGPRVNLGVALTDAQMQPDKPMKDFNPCQKCDTCVRFCPINAINRELPPPKGFDRSRCVQFVYKMREKTNRRIMLCGYCYNYCPVGEISEKTLHLGKWGTLLDLNEQKRKRLLQSLNI